MWVSSSWKLARHFCTEHTVMNWLSYTTHILRWISALFSSSTFNITSEIDHNTSTKFAPSADYFQQMDWTWPKFIGESIVYGSQYWKCVLYINGVEANEFMFIVRLTIHAGTFFKEVIQTLVLCLDQCMNTDEISWVVTEIYTYVTFYHFTFSCYSRLSLCIPMEGIFQIVLV